MPRHLLPGPHPGPQPHARFVVIAAGVAAALHVGKLPPAITALQDGLGLTLLQAGFLLSLVQGAGMLAGVAFGALADGMGLRRSMVLGLAVLGLASAAGAAADSVALLMALRAAEGFGFLLAVLPAPALLRQLAPAERLASTLGLWGAYMPLGVALALLAGPAWVGAFGWRSWWAVMALLTLLAAGVVAAQVPATPRRAGATAWPARLRRTLTARGPWWVAAMFGLYSAQWVAVIGFLPTLYLQAGVSGAATGVLTALAAAVNMVGNVGAGRLLQRGVPARRLLAIGYAVMALAALAAFAGVPGQGLPPALRYAAVLAFSAVGGLIPATLFGLAVRVAPAEDLVATTAGWMQQGSALGQFIGPPLVAGAAAVAGGWHWTWTVTAACAGVGLVLALGGAGRGGGASSLP